LLSFARLIEPVHDNLQESSLKYINIKHPDQVVSFTQAVTTGLGRDRGLFFPEIIPAIADMDSLLKMSFVERSVEILSHFVDEAFERKTLNEMVSRAFNFPVKVTAVESNVFALELFHGPSLAFKDFGARFLAECLSLLSSGPTTILTATSGDTGAAVAHAFFDQPEIRVVILYPEGRVSQFQEKLFCTLGNNIETFAVRSDFDECQAMVKQAFEDQQIRTSIHLNSANSINIGRLLAQVCYYFEAVAQLPRHDSLVVSVPSGNFGNLTAGLIAQAMGLPIQRFIAATNANDTVPRYFENNRWAPNPTQATLTNAMDISEPNNFPRIQWLFKNSPEALHSVVQPHAVSDTQTRELVSGLYESNYIAEPHTALAYGALKTSLQDNELGLFLGTAHPAKFSEIIEKEIGKAISIPPEFASLIEQPSLSEVIEPDFDLIKDRLLGANAFN
jgi:threonine synthase